MGLRRPAEGRELGVPGVVVGHEAPGEGAASHVVEEAAPAFSWEAFLTAMSTVWAATNAQSIDGFARAMGAEVSDETLEATTLAMVEQGRALHARHLLDALDVEVALTAMMAGFLSEHDVLLTPTLGALPPEIGRYDPAAPNPLHDTFADWSRWETFLPLSNVTGQPAISLPLHLSPEGLPIGMQLVGGMGQEALLLQLSAQLEQALPWAARTPPAYAG